MRILRFAFRALTIALAFCLATQSAPPQAPDHALHGQSLIIELDNDSNTKYEDLATITSDHTIGGVSASHFAKNDGEVRIGRWSHEAGFPGVVEIMNVATSGKAATKAARQAKNKKISATGAWRLWRERPGTGRQLQAIGTEPAFSLHVEFPSNPDHVFEIHSVTKVDVALHNEVVICRSPRFEAPIEYRSARDWKKSPAILELTTPEDVYALGDIHGDYDRLVSLLKAARIIRNSPDKPGDAVWNAGKAILVCTGDLIDKGKHSLKVIALFRALEASARESGGQVIVLMGNHEAEFLASPTDDDKAFEFLKELEKHGLKTKDVAAARDEWGVGTYLRSRPFGARVNDWFFAHAGDTGGRTLASLRGEIEEQVDANGFDAEILTGKHGLLEARLHPHPWWEKKDEDPAKGEKRLRHYVEALGAKHLVIGHQPGDVSFGDGTVRKKGKLIQKYDGLVFLIDVGLSDAIDYSRGALLHIGGQQNKAVAVINADGTITDIWP
jgi:hypothetical protein